MLHRATHQPGWPETATLGEGTIASNDRAEQRKIIKYNHLVANCLIFFNVFRMTQGLHTLQQSGQRLDPEALATLSPYGTAHVNRFGRYELDLTRQPPPVDYALLGDMANPNVS